MAASPALAEVILQGRVAFLDGQPWTANPHPFTDASDDSLSDDPNDAWSAWDLGWCTAEGHPGSTQA